MKNSKNTLNNKDFISGKKAQNSLWAGIEIDYVAPYEAVVMYISLDDLHIDKKYQRPTVKPSVSRMYSEMEERALGLLQVGRRIGTDKHYVLDGQNRLQALIERADDGLSTQNHILCLVHLDTTRQEEAELFVLLNTNKPVTGNARFAARLMHKGNPEYLIDRMVDKAGFCLEFLAPGKPTANSKIRNGIRSVAMLLKCYNKCSAVMPNAFDLLKAVYGIPERVPYDLRVGPVVFGLSMFLNDSPIKDAKLIANAIKARCLDMAKAWDDCKNSSSSKCFQHDQAKLFSKWLSDSLGNGIVGKVA